MQVTDPGYSDEQADKVPHTLHRVYILAEQKRKQGMNGERSIYINKQEKYQIVATASREQK